MSAGNGKAAPEEIPWGGNGPCNLSPAQLQQAFGLSKLLEYQQRVRVLTEQLKKIEEEREM